MALQPGMQAPNFTLRNQSLAKVSLGDLLGDKSMIVFVPYPFTNTCTEELCNIRDSLASLNAAGAKVVVITTHAASTNAAWVKQNGFNFDVLADYWPHGKVSQAYDAFDERYGYSTRVTYFLDSEGVIRQVIKSDVFGEPRDYDSYGAVLAEY